MNTKSHCIRAFLLAIGIPFVFVVGCRREEEPPPAPAEAPEAAELDPAVQAKLAEADALDGEVDYVVSRCAGCALGMDGSEAHALKVGEYSMHFCSDHCRSQFAEGPVAAIRDMDIPALSDDDEEDEDAGEGD